MFTVRRAVVSDADAIARVHVASWRYAYAHILPADLLANLDEKANAERKRRLIEENHCVLVAEEEASILAFAMCGPLRYPRVPADGELSALYAHPTALQRGIGTALLRAAAEHLVREGFVSMAVYVFRDNTQARSFYAKHGAEHYDSDVFEVAGVPYPDEGYIWRSVKDLVARLG